MLVLPYYQDCTSGHILSSYLVTLFRYMMISALFRGIPRLRRSPEPLGCAAPQPWDKAAPLERDPAAPPPSFLPSFPPSVPPSLTFSAVMMAASSSFLSTISSYHLRRRPLLSCGDTGAALCRGGALRAGPAPRTALPPRLPAHLGGQAAPGGPGPVRRPHGFPCLGRAAVGHGAQLLPAGRVPHGEGRGCLQPAAAHQPAPPHQPAGQRPAAAPHRDRDRGHRGPQQEEAARGEGGGSAGQEARHGRTARHGAGGGAAEQRGGMRGGEGRTGPAASPLPQHLAVAELVAKSRCAVRCTSSERVPISAVLHKTCCCCVVVAAALPKAPEKEQNTYDYLVFIYKLLEVRYKMAFPLPQ